MTTGKFARKWEKAKKKKKNHDKYLDYVTACIIDALVTVWDTQPWPPTFIGTTHDDDDDVQSRNDIQLNIHHICYHCELYPSVVDFLVDLYTSLTVLNISTPWIFDWGHFKGRKVPTATIHFHLLSEWEYWNVTSNLFCSSLVAYKDSLNFIDMRKEWNTLWQLERFVETDVGRQRKTIIRSLLLWRGRVSTVEVIHVVGDCRIWKNMAAHSPSHWMTIMRYQNDLA